MSKADIRIREKYEVRSRLGDTARNELGTGMSVKGNNQTELSTRNKKYSLANEKSTKIYLRNNKRSTKT